MKVLIINPPWPGKGIGTRSQNRIIKQRGDMYLQFPIFLGYAASQLREAGYKVDYIDSVVQNLDQQETDEKIRKSNPDVILMETTTPSIKYDFKAMESMKNSTGAIIIAVGPHVTVFPRESLQECKSIDIIIKKEFDTRIVEVLDNLHNLKKIKGIVFRDDSKIEDTGEAKLFDDLDSLPYPDRETIPHEWYCEAWHSKKPFLYIISSRGCPYHCTFCLWPNAMYGHKVRYRSLDNFVDEIHYLADKYGAKEIYIDDDTFTVNKKRVLDFCNKMKREGLDYLMWSCNARVDTVDDEMLQAMKSAGCKMLKYGVESGSQEVLEKIRKGYTLDQVRKAFELTKKHKILVHAGFMFGFPFDSKETVEKTLEIAKELAPDSAQFSIAMAYPGTVLYEQAKENNWVLAKEWEEYDMTHGPVLKTQDMNREDLEDILSRAYREFYFRPQFFLQTLKNIRTLTDVGRVLRSAKSTIIGKMTFYKSSKDACD